MGIGVWIKISDSKRIHISWNARPDTNTMAELIALWSGLYAGYNLRIRNAHISGDSKGIVGIFNGGSSLNSPMAQGWMQRTKRLWELLEQLPISHIYRELNTREDKLSKIGLDMVFGIMRVEQYLHGDRVWTSDIPIP